MKGLTALLDELDALTAAATPGPWEASGLDSGHSEFETAWAVVTTDVRDIVCEMDDLSRATLNEKHQSEGGADARFIAAARHALPLLVEYARRVQELAERLPHEMHGNTSGAKAHANGRKSVADDLNAIAAQIVSGN